eukprot:gene1196-721_t
MPESPISAQKSPMSFEPVLAFAEVDDDPNMVTQQALSDVDSLDDVHNGGSVGSKSPMNNNSAQNMNKNNSTANAKSSPKRQSIRRGQAPNQSSIESPPKSGRTEKGSSKNSTMDKHQKTAAAKSDPKNGSKIVDDKNDSKNTMTAEKKKLSSSSPVKNNTVKSSEDDEEIENPVDLSLGRSLNEVMGDISEFNKKMRKKLDRANGIIAVPRVGKKPQEKSLEDKQKQLADIQMSEEKLNRLKQEASEQARREIMGTFGKRGLSMGNNSTTNDDGNDICKENSKMKNSTSSSNILQKHVESKMSTVSTKKILERELDATAPVENINIHKNSTRKKIGGRGMPQEDEDERAARYRAMQRAAKKRQQEKERLAREQAEIEEKKRKRKEENEKKAREGLQNARKRLADKFGDRGSVVSYQTDLRSVNSSVARYASDPATPEVEEMRRKAALRLREKKLEKQREEEMKLKKQQMEEERQKEDKERSKQYHEEFRKKVAEQIRKKKAKQRLEKEIEEEQIQKKLKEKEEKAQHYERLAKEAARRVAEQKQAKKAAEMAEEREKLIDEQQHLFEKAQKFKMTPIPQSLIRKVETLHDQADVPLPPPVPPSPKKLGPPKRDRKNSTPNKNNVNISTPVSSVRKKSNSRPGSGVLRMDRQAREKKLKKDKELKIQVENERVERVVVKTNNLWGDSESEEEVSRIPEEIEYMASPSPEFEPEVVKLPPIGSRSAKKTMRQNYQRSEEINPRVEVRQVQQFAAPSKVQEVKQFQQTTPKSSEQKRRQEEWELKQVRKVQQERWSHRKQNDVEPNHAEEMVEPVDAPEIHEVKQYRPSSSFQRLIQPKTDNIIPLNRNPNEIEKQSSPLYRPPSNSHYHQNAPAVPGYPPPSSRHSIGNSSPGRGYYQYDNNNIAQQTPNSNIPIYRPPVVHGHEVRDGIQWNSYNKPGYGIKSEHSASSMGSPPKTPVVPSAPPPCKYYGVTVKPPPPPPRSRSSRPGSARRDSARRGGYDLNASIMTDRSRMSVDSSRPSSRRGRVNHDLPPVQPSSKRTPQRQRDSKPADRAGPATKPTAKRVSPSPEVIGHPQVRKDSNPVWRQSKIGVRTKEQILADKLAKLQNMQAGKRK